MHALRTMLYLSLLLMIGCDSESLSVAPTNQVGQGGSMARFAIKGDALYVVDRQNINVFDISEEKNPTKAQEVTVGFGIETIFPYQNHLFIGGQQGMYIYDATQALAPTFLSEYQHVESCDPVVAQGDYAYVTLRSGTQCRRAINELHVLDISKPSDPSLVRAYPMENPHGLGVDGDLLFLCDGNAGLKVFNISNPSRISDSLLVQFPDVHAYDVIPMNGILMLIGQDGLFQYQYSQNQTIELLSKIEIERDDA